jgi:hypothetical protein
MEIIKINRGHESYTLFVTPGSKVEIHTYSRAGDLTDVKVFRIGDIAEYDSYNLTYTAPIKQITAKNVIFDMGERWNGNWNGRKETKRLTMDSFAWRNHDFDAERIAARNASVSMCI